MRIVSLKVHGILDYITVVVFVISPAVLGFGGLPSYVSYTLAIVHLLMTLLSDFPCGLLRVIPMKIHKLVEIVVGPVLIVLPWILGFDVYARYFFMFAGAAIISVGMVTDYFEVKKGSG